MKLSYETADHLAEIIYSTEGNGKDIVDLFRGFCVDFDDEDVQVSGYCGAGGKLPFSKKYCRRLSDETKLANFILSYLNPRRFVGETGKLQDLVDSLNGHLKYDDIILEIYDSGRKIKFTSTEISGDGANVEHFFDSESIYRETLRYIKEAKRNILINMYMLTSQDIINLLVEKSSQSIDVQLILDDNLKNKEALEKHDIDFHIMFVKGWDSGEGINHHKYYIIDDRFLLSGTANATFSGLKKNDENLTISDDLISINKYRENFITTKRHVLCQIGLKWSDL